MPDAGPTSSLPATSSSTRGPDQVRLQPAAVIKPGSVAIVIMPDRRHTFDAGAAYQVRVLPRLLQRSRLVARPLRVGDGRRRLTEAARARIEKLRPNAIRFISRGRQKFTAFQRDRSVVPVPFEVDLMKSIREGIWVSGEAFRLCAPRTTTSSTTATARPALRTQRVWLGFSEGRRPHRRDSFEQENRSRRRLSKLS